VDQVFDSRPSTPANTTGSVSESTRLPNCLLSGALRRRSVSQLDWRVVPYKQRDLGGDTENQELSLFLFRGWVYWVGVSGTRVPESEIEANGLVEQDQAERLLSFV